jgi:Flp pilus assembly protein TadG
MSAASKSKRCGSQKGHAMLELAIVAGVMVSFLVGTFQFGYSFYVYNQLVTAVGNGARYAAQRTYRAATPDDVERGKAAIRNMVVYGDAQPAAGAIPLVAGLTPQQVNVEWLAQDGQAPTAVDVSIRDYTPASVFKPITFDGKPFAEFPYVGRYAPAEREP